MAMEQEGMGEQEEFDAQQYPKVIQFKDGSTKRVTSREEESRARQEFDAK